MNKLFACLILFILFNSYSCKPEGAMTIDLNEIEGNWKIIEAKRNGNITGMLDRGFVGFQGNQLLNNLNGDTTSYTYNIDGHVINSDDPVLSKLNVRRMSNDTAIFNTEFGGYKFEFLMKKE